MGALCWRTLPGCKNFDKDSEEVEKASKSLDKYYIPTRYPETLPGIIPSEAFDKDDAQKAISLAEKIINFIKSKTKGELY
jgi:HEPN domain-containing protein